MAKRRGTQDVDQHCHLIDGLSLARVLKEAGVAMLTLTAAPAARPDLTLEPRDRRQTEGIGRTAGRARKKSQNTKRAARADNGRGIHFSAGGPTHKRLRAA